MAEKNKRVYFHYENDNEAISTGLPDFTTKLELQPKDVVPIHSLLETFVNTYNTKFGGAGHSLSKTSTRLSSSKSSKAPFIDMNANANEVFENGHDVYVHLLPATTELKTCYHNGCGNKFNPLENHPEACTYHPQGPIFHEGLKGWACCSKRVIDFNDFMNIVGCTRGYHSDEKPATPPTLTPPKETNAANVVTTNDGVEVYTSTKPPIAQPTPAQPTPPEKPKEEKEIENDPEDAVISIGTSCKRNGCNATYNGPTSKEETCISHAGSAIFHEGSKFWSCCKTKTAEFEAFLRIPGCVHGKHKFLPFKGDDLVKCRYDFYQMGAFAIVNVYAKNVDKDATRIQFEGDKVMVRVQFKDGKLFEKTLFLSQYIVPEESKYEVLSTKVEIKLKKKDLIQWSQLEYE